MPRTNMCRRVEPHEQLGRLIVGVVGLKANPAAEVAAILKCSEGTARSRLRHPGDLTVNELTCLGRGLHIPIAEMRDAIRY